MVWWPCQPGLVYTVLGSLCGVVALPTGSCLHSAGVSLWCGGLANQFLFTQCWGFFVVWWLCQPGLVYTVLGFLCGLVALPTRSCLHCAGVSLWSGRPANQVLFTQCWGLFVVWWPCQPGLVYTVLGSLCGLVAVPTRSCLHSAGVSLWPGGLPGLSSAVSCLEWYTCIENRSPFPHCSLENCHPPVIQEGVVGRGIPV